ncbi:MAG: FAD-dependent oxidoreductase [Alphaproteobacteria bacterium]|jgi:glycine/D-amino acid oxidase-like deaminating enzyme|nr:FAD-dependent oxidoreductase [Rhodospirillaceae bacterium]MBT7613025.1 FAD-dependent oxidoreductase [Rhodospirillaceae bacterium]MBT7648924.1 FAD-dependent oxidoreductase [Rhodospirillaceae bacterium]MDG2479261.1 FAD-dependent oxidoreductase [Alphaproteobacteria bacterium]
MESVWLRDALKAESGTTITPLDGDLKVDVAIVGGGYTGLWTAIELKSRDPSLDVVIIERDICGAGGSGANAGHALPMWLQLPLLEQASDTESAMHIANASLQAIEDIRNISAEHDIDTQISATNTVWAATCEKQSSHWDEMLRLMEGFQVRSYQYLDKDAVREATGSDALIAGVVDTSSVLLHPGHLVRGLRRVALSKGVHIFEKTEMIKLGRSSPPTVTTPQGTVTAKKVVLGLYGWSLSIPELRSSAMVMYTDAAITKPIPKMLDELGIRGVSGFTDSRVFIEACRPTADDRMFWTKSGGWLPYGDRLDPIGEKPFRTEGELRDVLGAYHPGLRDVEIDGMWSGPIDRTKNGMPIFGRLPTCRDILFGYGYSGAGVVPSRVGSHILASLVQERDDQWTRSPLVSPLSRDFPPEPFRWIGGQIVKAAISHQDHRDHQGREVGPITRFWLQFKPGSYKPS